MALDPSIISQLKPVQLPDTANLLQLSQLSNQNAAQRLNLQQAQRKMKQEQTLSDLYRTNTNPDGTVNNDAVTAGMSQAGFGSAVPGLQEQSQKVTAGGLDIQAKQLAVHKQNLDLVNNSLASLISDPDLTHDKVITKINGLVNQGIIDSKTGAQMVQTLPGPAGLKQFLISKALETTDASKQIEMQLPKYNEQDRGGVINEGTVDPMTGQRTAGANIDKTPTKGEILTNARLTSGGLGDAAIDLAARRLLNGEKSSAVLANFGRGQQGARDIAAVQNRLASLASEQGVAPEDIASKQQELSAVGKSLQVAGGQAGKVAVGLNELKQFGPLVTQASAAVPRGNFVPWNKLKQMADTSISDPALLRFKTQMTALENAYNQVAARGGSDVGKREHIHQLFSTANSPEAVATLVDAVNQEAQSAETAAQDAMKAPPRKPAASTGIPADVQAALDKHGG